MLSLVAMFSPHLGGKMVLLLQSNYLLKVIPFYLNKLDHSNN